MAKPPKKPDGFDMFCYASEYRSAVRLLSDAHWRIVEKRNEPFKAKNHSPSTDEWAIFCSHVPGWIASYVLTALSLEIYLKCLHRVRGRVPPRGHNLKKIFQSLSIKDRREIKKRYLTKYSLPPARTVRKR